MLGLVFEMRKHLFRLSLCHFVDLYLMTVVLQHLCLCFNLSLKVESNLFYSSLLLELINLDCLTTDLFGLIHHFIVSLLLLQQLVFSCKLDILLHKISLFHLEADSNVVSLLEMAFQSTDLAHLLVVSLFKLLLVLQKNVKLLKHVLVL